MRFRHFKQHDSMDCGPTCLKMIAKYYGKNIAIQGLRIKCQINKLGVSLLGISNAAENIGFKTLPVKLNFEQLKKDAVLPSIVHWKKKHFVVVVKIKKERVMVADPAVGILTLSKEEFLSGWIPTIEGHNQTGIALLLEPTVDFHNVKEEETPNKITLGIIAKSFAKYRGLYFQLAIGLVIGSILQLLLPFLTQSVVDIGIADKDINFITLILVGQLLIFVGNSIIEIIRSWILLHVSTRINISLITDFLIKLMNLPLSYFESKTLGDIIQRIGDHKRIESFLTNSVLSTAFSLLNFITLNIIVIAYDVKLFLVFIIGSSLYFGWILFFMKMRKKLDFMRFETSSANQGATIEIIQGIQEIKLNNCQKEMRWKWERIQARSFTLGLKWLYVNQFQQAGALFINQGKNVIISYLSAKAVIDGKISLGSMMAIQYVMGQLNGPLQQMIQFFQSHQDAKISLERVNEVYEINSEESVNNFVDDFIPENRNIVFKDAYYQYPGMDNNYVLKNINLKIPQGEITAIVGMSGSGKTTLLKLILRLYELSKGEILIGSTKFKNISHRAWRERCGTVMQDGYIFSDTISANIAVGDEFPDSKRLQNAIHLAKLEEYVDSLHYGINTKIGSNGKGMSEGQRQRILIARAIYKNPEYILFDEATNSLDANNETSIMQNLHSFFNGKTVVIVAHRLSTIRNAHNIVVMQNGEIMEQGTHEELISLKGDYFKLIKNQLEFSY